MTQRGLVLAALVLAEVIVPILLFADALIYR